MPVVAALGLEDLIGDTLWPGIGLVVALVVAIWLIFRIRSWYGGDADRREGDAELILHLRGLQREGQVSEEEYRSIKGRLVERTDR